MNCTAPSLNAFGKMHSAKEKEELVGLGQTLNVDSARGCETTWKSCQYIILVDFEGDSGSHCLSSGDSTRISYSISQKILLLNMIEMGGLDTHLGKRF